MPRFPLGKLCLWRFAAHALCAAPLCAGACFAASGSGDTLDLPSVETRGARPAASEAGVYRLDAESLRRFATLEDALASLPGFQVRRQGGLGGYSELSFRGARAASVDIYVDGIRLNQDGDGAPDLSKWPLLWFSSLEARTGIGEDNGGPGTLARIDLSTRSGTRAEAHARLGSFATAEVAASAQAGVPFLKGWTFTAAVEGQRARNDYLFFSDNGTLYNTSDDGTWRMENNAYAGQGARASLRREDAAGLQSFSVLWLDNRKEYPGLFPSTAQAYGTRTDWLAAWRMRRDAGALPWEAGVQGRRFEDAYRDPAQTLGYLSYEAARVSFSGETDARARLPLPDVKSARFDARVDTRLRAEETKPLVTPYSQAYSSPEALRGEAQAGLALDARLKTRWASTLEARGSFVRFRAEGLKVSNDTAPTRLVSSDRFPFALRAALQRTGASHSLGLHARIEQRAPSSGELLGDNLGIKTKLDLRPEETRAISLMHAFAPRGNPPLPWRVQSSLFRNDYRNPIRLKAHGASAFMRYENDADYRSIGFETSSSWNARRSEGLLTITLQEAEITSGLYKGNQPAHQSPLEAHAEFFVKPSDGKLSARAGLLADFRAAYYPGDANVPDSRRGAEWEFGAHADARRGPVRLALDARNLADRRHRDFAYSPRSGRSYAMSLSFTL